MQDITIEPSESNDSGPCDCCGAMSRTVWGYLSVDGDARAVYYVQWTRGEVPRHGANFDLLMGSWGDDTTPEQRVAVSLFFRIGEQGPEFGSIDAAGRPHAETGLAAHALVANRILANRVAADAYQFVHAVMAQDPRLEELIEAVSAS